MEEGMDLTTPLILGALLAVFTAIQTWINKGRFDTLERGQDALARRMDAHEQSNELRFQQLASEIAGLRSDLTHVALAVGARTRPQTG
jgi:hypothetical protein